MRNEPFLPDDGIEWHIIENEAFILDTVASSYFALNETATQIFIALLEGQSKAQVVSALVAQYDVAPQTALQDVNDLLHQLSAKTAVL